MVGEKGVDREHEVDQVDGLHGLDDVEDLSGLDLRRRRVRGAAWRIAAVWVGGWIVLGRAAMPAAAQDPAPARRIYLPLAQGLAADWRTPPPSVTPAARPSATADRAPSASPTALPGPSPSPTAAPPTPSPAPSPTAAVKVEGARVTTAHYDLWVEGLDGAEVGHLLEAAYVRWEAFFGGAPEGRLPGRIYATAEAMAAGMAADGIRYGGGGGYYHPGNRTFYAFAQPSAFFSRMLILHEGTHQFHYLAATGNQGYAGFWFGEGLAEHFGMHNWDGTRLSQGVIPAISLEDYPAQALAEFDAKGQDLAALVADQGGWTRPSGWGVVSWLLDERPAEARLLFARLNAREAPSGAWEAVFGPIGAADVAAYRAWLAGHQQPWREVWRSFEERGEALVGSSGVNALAVRKTPVDALTVSLEPLAGTLRAGLVLGYTDPQHFVVVQVLASRDLWVFRMTPAGWQWVTGGRAAAPPPDGRDRLAARRAPGGGWIAAVNGVDVVTVPDEGLPGLNVDGCTVAFRVE